MRKITFGVSIIILLNLLSMNIFAAEYYIRAGASGSNNGNDWTNAYTSLPSTYTRGDTYYIASGTYNGNWVIDSAESGSTWTYIRKATGAGHGTGTGWNDSYATGPAVINGSLAINNSIHRGRWCHGFGKFRARDKGKSFDLRKRWECNPFRDREKSHPSPSCRGGWIRV